jgi:hypothetical protein
VLKRLRTCTASAMNAASKSGFARTETTLVTSAQTLEYPCPCRESPMSWRQRRHGARDPELHLSYGMVAMKGTRSMLSDAVAAAPSFTVPWPPMVGPRLLPGVRWLPLLVPAAGISSSTSIVNRRGRAHDVTHAHTRNTKTQMCAARCCGP